MLKAAGLRKSFGATKAVDGVSLALEPGRILGLLGPNGAGKTTTVSMLAGLLAPDAGEVSMQGRPLKGDADPGKRLMGLVPQEIALYEELTARDNLALFGALYGLQGCLLNNAMASSLAFVGLSDKAKDKVKTFSGGMKRRLNLAAGLLHGPARPSVGRAHGRRRSSEPERHLRQPRSPQGARQGHALHDALHGGGGAPLRLPRDRGPRDNHRRGNPQGAPSAQSPGPTASWWSSTSPTGD